MTRVSYLFFIYVWVCVLSRAPIFYLAKVVYPWSGIYCTYSSQNPSYTWWQEMRFLCHKFASHSLQLAWSGKELSVWELTSTCEGLGMYCWMGMKRVASLDDFFWTQVLMLRIWTDSLKVRKLRIGKLRFRFRSSGAWKEMHDYCMTYSFCISRWKQLCIQDFMESPSQKLWLGKDLSAVIRFVRSSQKWAIFAKIEEEKDVILRERSSVHWNPINGAFFFLILGMSFEAGRGRLAQQFHFAKKISLLESFEKYPDFFGQSREMTP